MSIYIFRQGTHTISVYDVAGVKGRKKYVYKNMKQDTDQVYM